MKKEDYYSEEKVREWSNKYGNSEYHKNYKFNLDHAALLIIDMQEYFLNSNYHAFIPSGNSILPNIFAIKSLFMDNQRPIVITQHIDSNNKNNSLANNMINWWKDYIDYSDCRTELIKDLQNIQDPNVHYLEKNQYNVFHNTQLEEMLIKKKVSQVVITGVSTHLCCESSARDAFMRGFEVFFMIDGTSTFNELLHTGTLQSISHGFGICLTTKDLIKNGE